MIKALQRAVPKLREISLLFVITAILVSSKHALAGSLLISWDPVADSRVAGYKIKYGTVSKSYSQSVSVGAVNSYTLPNLIEGTTYYFVIVAHDANLAEGVPSAEASGTVLKVSGTASTLVTSTSAVISWQTNKPSDSQVSYGTTASYGSTTGLDSSLVNTHSQTLTNLLPETTYHFQVRSKDAGGSVSVSSDLTFTTAPGVTILTLSPTGGSTGIEVIIDGKGFGTTQGSSSVTFNGVQASVKAWANSSITTTVPANAVSGPVVVTVNGNQSNAVNFKINGKLAAPGRIRVKG